MASRSYVDLTAKTENGFHVGKLPQIQSQLSGLHLVNTPMIDKKPTEELVELLDLTDFTHLDGTDGISDSEPRAALCMLGRYARYFLDHDSPPSDSSVSSSTTRHGHDDALPASKRLKIKDGGGIPSKHLQKTIDLLDEEVVPEEQLGLSRDGNTRHVIDLLEDEVVPFKSSLLEKMEIEKEWAENGRRKKLHKATCAIGKTLEFTDGTFMRIHTITKSPESTVYITGQVFFRQNCEGPKMPKRDNEVMWLVNQSSGINGLKRRKLVEGDILRNRNLILTNQSFPMMSTKDHPDSLRSPRQNRRIGPLFCRWKCIEYVQNGRTVAEDMLFLTESEADPSGRADRNKLRDEARQVATVTGGSHVQFTYDVDQGVNIKDGSKYTLADIYCGAGGVSCGAQMAGLQIVSAVDNCPAAIATYRRNFPRVRSRQQDVYDFILRLRDQCPWGIDIVHISPPCQAFSPANTGTSTVQGELKNESNQASLFSVHELIRAVRPRVVTMEQTDGLVSRHPEFFNALLNTLIDLGFAYRWKIVNSLDYGVPQRRWRLILFASPQGDSVPTIPEPTHGPNSVSRQKPPHINTILSQIPLTATEHDIFGARFEGQARSSYNGNRYANTITTGGGEGNYHPSGLRRFTLREFASLQTFPPTFELANVGKTKKLKQIGNAVPPLLAKTLFAHIKKWLQRRDNVDYLKSRS